MNSESKNAFMAILFSAVILFGWQYFFSPKTPQSQSTEAKTEVVQQNNNQTIENTNMAVPTAPAAGPIEPVTFAELKSGSNAIVFDNKLNISDFTHGQSVFDFKSTVGDKSPLKIEILVGDVYKEIPFVLTKNSDTQIALTNADFGINGQLNLIDNTQANIKIKSDKGLKYRLTFMTEPKKLENGQLRKFAFYNNSLESITVGEDEKFDTTVKWAGIDFNYHLFALYFSAPQTLMVETKTENKMVITNTTSVDTLDFNLAFVKKEYNYLTSLGHNLNGSVDFGIWGFFAVWILKGLQFFYKFVPNYGISILFLTLLIRLVTFPLQYKSFVSMKKLQIIQPEMTKIREKYKDDPVRMQKETMDLFKRSGANPLGGCLPMLLQMPVFFAFYKVLYSAVELVNAPFFAWIHDLSQKDPYYVLPVLMTIAMFLQQKMTPNTITDPVQKKIMLFMPLVFGFIMKDLPSGLSLYIFASTVLGIVQQLMVFKAKTDTNTVVVA